MTSPIVESTDADVTMVATGGLIHRCPFADEVDAGHFRITWRCLGETFELHSLAAYLKEWTDTEISHEEITDRIRHDLGIHAGIHLISVETIWKTAGLEVSCSTSPTPAETP